MMGWQVRTFVSYVIATVFIYIPVNVLICIGLDLGSDAEYTHGWNTCNPYAAPGHELDHGGRQIKQ
jgi:hypothetical protein